MSLRNFTAAVVTVSLAVVVIPALPAQAAAPTSVTPAQTAHTTAPMAAKATKKRGIKVEDASVSADGRLVTARLKWDARLRKRDGNNHRFHMRLVAVKKNGKAHELDQFSTKKLKAKHSNVVTNLGRKKAKRARNAHGLVLSLTQQHDHPDDGDKLYESTFVTTISAVNRSAWPPEPPRVVFNDPKQFGMKDCKDVKLQPGADLTSCYLAQAHLERADLSGAILSNTDLSRTKLSGANLSGAKVTGCTDRRGISLLMPLQECIDPPLFTVDFEGADLTNADLRGAQLPLATFGRAKLDSAKLYGAEMSHANFLYTDLTRADLRNMNLQEASMVNVNLTDANLTSAHMFSAWLDKATLTRANLTSANLAHAYLNSANVTHANLTKTNLTQADLRAKLMYANLTEANLTEADLPYADLTGANLYGADMTGAKLELPGFSSSRSRFCNTTMPDGRINNDSC